MNTRRTPRYAPHPFDATALVTLLVPTAGSMTCAVVETLQAYWPGTDGGRRRD